MAVVDRIKIPQNNLGLTDNIVLDRLQDVVIFAGKNGSGKSRLLNQLVSLYSFPDEFKYEDQASHLEKLLLEDNLLDEPTRKNYEQQINTFRRVNTRIPESEIRLIKIAPHIFDKNNQTRRNDHSSPGSNFSLNFDQISKYILNFLNGELNYYVYKTHQNYSHMFDYSEATNRFNTLNKLLIDFLGVEIKPGNNGRFSLFEFENDINHLSKGQEVILQLIVHLFEAKVNENVVLLFDEPENHLHPDVLIKLIEALLKKYEGRVQIFMATHSIPLIAHYQDKSLYYLHDGNVTYAGDKPQLVLEGLLGDEEERERLRTFVSLPEIMAANNYAYQCLFEPVTVGTNPEDKQVKQIKELLKTGKKLKVLDFGAGQGRLLDSIYEGEKNNGDITDWLDYYAFDTSPKNKAKCIDALSKVYSNTEEKYYSNEGDILTAGRCRFDVVVMCNVLHEIDPKDWETLFGEKGFIYKALKDDGYLLIVEDEHIPVGEKAYNNGFILLRPEDLQTLFKTDDSIKHSYYDDNKRLVAMQVPKNWLIGYSKDTRDKCLTEVQSRAKAEIDRIRKIPEPSYKDGLKHALYVQQLANTTLALT